ncbi:efflux RND transporter permease subunit [Bradyrhizobium jicamae]|uniref:Efflux RND transporter permease subunit n=1 Tax=Bradyrhizobium jicamae TaxID=280332 RepID=A0ABS5FS05_9BRAD|nr:efflux RND transporter permease subunit [Bradyrhizobium jicamae]MBR0799594.1 efflux RND transporter permease subunit [Bradyrhizobium jicamae]
MAENRSHNRRRRLCPDVKLSELEKRFPNDLAWKITYDPTVFVTNTIHEVKKTLIEAFILVVLVVFLRACPA